MDSRELAWASGLFEGEGWISAKQKSYVSKRTCEVKLSISPALGIQSSDLAVLQRMQAAVGGLGAIYYRKPRIYKYEAVKTRKEQWAWRVDGFERVQAVVCLLWYGLSQRRRDRAKEVLKNTTHNRYIPMAARSSKRAKTGNTHRIG